MSDKKSTTNTQQATNFNTNTNNTSNSDAQVNSTTTNGTLTNNTGATTGTSAGTTQSTLPAWAQSLLQGYGTEVGNLSTTDPSSLVAGPSTLQTQAFNDASNLSSDPTGGYGLASSLIGLASGTTAPQATAGQATASDATGLINGFLNPATNDVVNSTLADYDQNAGQQKAAYAAQGALNNAFGGSGYAIGSTNLDAALARARATTDSNLRSTAYQNAVTSALQQAGLNTNASVTNANNGTTAGIANANLKNDSINRLLTSAGLLQTGAQQQGASTLANLQEQAALGSTQQGIDQAKLQAPITLAGQIGSLLGQGQFNLLGGQTTSGSTAGTSASSGSTLGQQIIDALTATNSNETGTSSGTTNSTGTNTTTTSDPLGGLGSVLSAIGALGKSFPALGNVGT